MSLLIQYHLNGKEKLLVFHSIASHPLGKLVGLWDCFSTRICTAFINGCEHRSMGAFGGWENSSFHFGILFRSWGWGTGIGFKGFEEESPFGSTCFSLTKKRVFLKTRGFFFCLAESFTERSFSLLLCKLVPFHSIKENKERNALPECRSP